MCFVLCCVWKSRGASHQRADGWFAYTKPYSLCCLFCDVACHSSAGITKRTLYSYINSGDSMDSICHEAAAFHIDTEWRTRSRMLNFCRSNYYYTDATQSIHVLCIEDFGVCMEVRVFYLSDKRWQLYIMLKSELSASCAVDCFCAPSGFCMFVFDWRRLMFHHHVFALHNRIAFMKWFVYVDKVQIARGQHLCHSLIGLHW